MDRQDLDDSPLILPAGRASPLKPTPIVIDKNPAAPVEEAREEQPEVVEVDGKWSLNMPSSKIFVALAGLCLGVYSIAFLAESQRPWPSPDEVSPEILSAPFVGPSHGKAFEMRAEQDAWRLLPSKEIEMSALVTSAQVPSKWFSVESSAQQRFAPVRATVAWGGNVRMGYYRQGTFGSTASTGYAMGVPEEWHAGEFAFVQFIPSNEIISAMLKELRAGDQFRVKGVLTRCGTPSQELGGYLGEENPSAGGLDAKMLYVEEFTVLKKHQPIFRLIRRVSMLVGAACLALAVFARIFPPPEEKGE